MSVRLFLLHLLSHLTFVLDLLRVYGWFITPARPRLKVKVIGQCKSSSIVLRVLIDGRSSGFPL